MVQVSPCSTLSSSYGRAAHEYRVSSEYRWVTVRLVTVSLFARTVGYSDDEKSSGHRVSDHHGDRELELQYGLVGHGDMVAVRVVQRTNKQRGTHAVRWFSLVARLQWYPLWFPGVVQVLLYQCGSRSGFQYKWDRSAWQWDSVSASIPISMVHQPIQ